MNNKRPTVSIGSNVLPLVTLPVTTVMGMAVPAANKSTAYKLADAVGEGLFKALRVSDKVYGKALPMLAGAISHFNSVEDDEVENDDDDDLDCDIRGTNGASSMNGSTTVNGYSTVNGNRPSGSLTS